MNRALLVTFALIAVTVRAADPLPSWNTGAAKKSVTDFVEKVTKEGAPDFVPPAERIAVFDNDGTLWSEQPMYFQLAFAIDRVRALAPQHPEWKENEPFKSALAGDKWIAENRPLTREVPSYPRSEYPVPAKRHDDEIRAFYEEALKQSQERKPLIDVRSPGEFKGEITHMPEYPQEGVLRGGHIPGAKASSSFTGEPQDAIVTSSRAHPFLNAAINSLASYSSSLRRTTR